MNLFRVEDNALAIVIKCPTALDIRAAQELLNLVKGWVQKPSSLYVLDFSEVTRMDQVVYRPLVLFHQVLKKYGAYIATINIRPEISTQIQAGGLDSVVSPKKTIEEAIAAAGLKVASTNYDPAIVSSLINSIKSTLEVQANTKVTIGEHRVKQLDEIHDNDIAAVISLTSSTYNGSVALCFPSKVFLHIYSNMLGEKHETITRETEDAAGELLNMIFGMTKAELNNTKGYDLQKAIPAIVRGAHLRVHHLNRGVTLFVPCQTDAGPFHVEIGMEPA